MYCPDCNENLDVVPVGDPCPSCGGQRRSAKAYAETAGAVAIADQVTIEVTRGDRRPWTEKWLATLHHLDLLRTAYKPGVEIGNVEAEQRAMNFFVECDHLRDWLERSGTAIRGDIDRYWKTSESLARCNALCNTHKHHSRNRGGVTARIRKTAVGATGVRITIEVDWATEHAASVDALALAEECVATWRMFLDDHGIPLP